MKNSKKVVMAVSFAAFIVTGGLTYKWFKNEPAKHGIMSGVSGEAIKPREEKPKIVLPTKIERTNKPKNIQTQKSGFKKTYTFSVTQDTLWEDRKGNAIIMEPSGEIACEGKIIEKSKNGDIIIEIKNGDWVFTDSKGLGMTGRILHWWDEK